MIPWMDTVKETGKLTVYTGGLAGPWGHIFKEALHAFNVLSSAHKLGVAITESTRAPESEGGANVSVQTADATIQATFGDQTRSKDFGGDRLHGATLLFSREGFLEKAFIFLPTTPKVSLPRTTRPVGAGVLKLIAVHELFHACGLENEEHTQDDLFQGNPRVNAGDRAAGDKVLIGVGPKEMPPLYLGGSTAKNVKDLWAR
jgi:hypothetical protein